MRHGVHYHGFGRRPNARKALFKGLVISLVEHGRIVTTLAKAKELRRHVEKAITIGKKGDLNTRRLLISRFGNEKAVQTIMSDLSVRFKTRPGGYTRILKMTNRPGDNSPRALIEFVDYQLPEADKNADTAVKGDKGATKKAKIQAKSKAKAQKKSKNAKSAARKKAKARA